MKHVLTSPSGQFAYRRLPDANPLCDLLLGEPCRSEPLNHFLEIAHSARSLCLKAFECQAQRFSPVGFNEGMSTFGERVEKARKHAEYTQEQLADRVGMTQGQISKLELGTRKKSTNTLAIASACSVSAEWLDSGHGSMIPGGAMETASDLPKKPSSPDLERAALLLRRIPESGHSLVLTLLRAVESHTRTQPQTTGTASISAVETDSKKSAAARKKLTTKTHGQRNPIPNTARDLRRKNAL